MMNRNVKILSVILAISASIFVLYYMIDNIGGSNTNVSIGGNNCTLCAEKEIGTSRYGGYIENQSMVLHNNVWGLTDIEKKSNVAKSYIYYKYDGSFGWEWNRPDPKNGSNMYIPPIYPEVIIGNIPGLGDSSSNKQYFPIPTKGIKLFTSEIDYRYTKPVTGSYNLAYDIYWVDPSRSDRKKLNVMIWISGRLDNDDTIKYVSDGTNEYEYHYKAPAGSQYWPWHAFILKDQDVSITNHKVDIKKLLDQLPKGSIGSNWTIQGVELGSEIWKGSGRIEISKYEINLNNKIIH